MEEKTQYETALEGRKSKIGIRVRVPENRISLIEQFPPPAGFQIEERHPVDVEGRPHIELYVRGRFEPMPIAERTQLHRDLADWAKELIGEGQDQFGYLLATEKGIQEVNGE